MVIVGGGFSSPYYLSLFTVTLAAAMRYGYGPSLGIAMVYVSADTAGFVLSHSPIGGPLVFRSLLLPLTTVLAGYLREQAHRAETALHERLRQSNALNEATAVLGASLDLDSVLHAAARRYRAALRQPYGRIAGIRRARLRRASLSRRDRTARPSNACWNACAARRAPDQAAPRADDELIAVHRLTSGERAIVLELALPTRLHALATMAVAVPANARISLDSDILDQFVERITLAVENASLYRALADRSEDLQRAYSDLATAHQDLLSVDEMKTNFLANVSHELRTPLTSIRSFAELLLAYEDDFAVQKEFLHIISNESERLTRLVNDVLDISHIEAGHMAWRTDCIDVADAARGPRPHVRAAGQAGAAGVRRRHRA